MFKNYFISAIRSLKRFKLFTFLNIFGLASGIACSVLILLWVHDESSYDKFNASASHIYRLVVSVAATDAAVTPVPVAPALKQQLPQVENYARLSPLQCIVTVGSQRYDEKRIFYADPSFLKLFDFELVQGEKNAVLSRPDAAVVTLATAKKYFGTTDVIGKLLKVNDDVNGRTYQITGVMGDVPHNSHLQFDILLPFYAFEHSSSYSYDDGKAWGNFNIYTYLKTRDEFKGDAVSLAQLSKQIEHIHAKNDPTHIKTNFILQPLTDVHLKSNFILDVDGQGNSQHVQIFLIVAVFILGIACINFINLSTAVAGQRAKEVGLRKTIGASRLQLVLQFLGEYLLVALISLTIGVGLAVLALPLFNDIASKNISINFLEFKTISNLLLIALVVGLLSGSYPAFVLASFNPVKALKNAKAGNQKAFIRNGLVVAQFSISVVLMISTLVVNNQLKFIRSRDMGYDKNNLMYLQMPRTGDLQNNYQALKNIFSQNAGIENFTIIEDLPTALTTGTIDVLWEGKDLRKQTLFPKIGIDGNFIKTFGMRLLAGRTLDDSNAADNKNFVVNETALKVMNFTTATAIGKKISINGHKGEIVGVVRDFNFKPVKQAIEPLILSRTNRGGFVVIKSNPASMEKLIKKVKTAFQEVYPNNPFSYGFVDQDLNKLYAAEQRMGKLFNVFSLISIIISCLGLFGLATFATQRRFKEIGVRRTLGASSAGIVALLAKDFVKLVLTALLIAFPLEWLVMNKWLENYAFRITISWWMFVLSGVAALLIAIITISYQSVKAAIANPVDSLRNE